MPMYKAKLEITIVCPEDYQRPELTMTPKDIKDLLLNTATSGGYAIPCKYNGNKHTASMHVKAIEFESVICQHCGNKVVID